MAPRSYDAVTTGAAVFPSSHWGRILFSGPDHLDFLHRMTTNTFTGRLVGEGFEAVFCNHRGRIVELGCFCRVDDEETVAFVGSGRPTPLLQWLEKFRFSERLEWVDVTSVTGQAELVGPLALTMARELFGVDAISVPPLHLIPGVDPLRATRVDAFGHVGLRLWGAAEGVADAVAHLRAAGAQTVDRPTWGVVRVEWGVPEPGQELTDDRNPWEAGLDRAIALDKGCYIGQEVVARLHAYQKVKQRLVGLVLDAEVEVGANLVADGKVVGQVTSVARSPGLSRPVALAYLRLEHSAPGRRLWVPAPHGDAGARVEAFPLAPPPGRWTDPETPIGHPA